MLYLAFGLLLLIVLIGLKHWLSETDPQKLWQQMRWSGFLLGLGLFLVLLLSGRLAWAWAAGLAMLPWLSRIAMVHRVLGIFRPDKPRTKQHRRSDSAQTTHATMTHQQAAKILGITENASETEIRTAHKELMKRNHPDQGGSDYLAQMLNQARDTLLER